MVISRKSIGMRMFINLKYILLIMLVVFIFCGYAAAAEPIGGAMKISSPAFKHNENIPAKYTCEGEDISPELIIENIPAGAKSLALIVDDPDAPAGVWVHWVVFDMPVNGRIPENSVPGKLGITNSSSEGYNGPCPPSGTHRYFFKVYALDTLLNLKEGTSKGQLEKTMEGHILDNAELIGLYKRMKL